MSEFIQDMSNVPQPRHRFCDGQFVELDTCGVAIDHRLVIVSQIGKALVETVLTRTARERGAMHDWTLPDNYEQRYVLTHQRPTPEGPVFLDRSVVLKIGNELECAPWDDQDAGSLRRLGKIVAMNIEAPQEFDVLDNVIALFGEAVSEVPDFSIVRAA